jgi:hypothetical protein
MLNWLEATQYISIRKNQVIVDQGADLYGNPYKGRFWLEYSFGYEWSANIVKAKKLEEG